MKTLLIFLFCAIFSDDLLLAQRTEQPASPNAVLKAPLSNRVSYSASGRDSLRVEFINVDVPGLEIILDVVVKNRGATRSNTATVWLEYSTYKFKSYKIEKVLASARKGVPALDPGQTSKLSFTIEYSAPDKMYNQKVKGVRVSLTQNGGRAWRESE
jgi:hypothetical protein